MTRVNSPDSMVSMSYFFDDEVITSSGSIKPTGILKGVTTVDVSVEAAAAWEMAKMSRFQLSQATVHMVDRTYKVDNNHSAIFYLIASNIFPGMSPR